jgi:tetratricopeptide (TPR) repeat protein
VRVCGASGRWLASPGESGHGASVRIGRFQVIEPLTGHGDRRVLAAYDPRLDRKLAIELGAGRDDGDEARARRRQQARAMAQIGHANVVRVHEVGEHEGELFVATDFVRGGTLEDWCREHPPGSRERFAALLELLLQAARGLAAAHAAKVVGLPLGPGDMLVDADGRLRLRGWTMADAAVDERARSEGESESGKEGGGGQEADAAAGDDQRALCRTFWEAAIGSAPAAGAPDEPAAAARAEVPAWFVATLRRGLTRERRDRWPDVDGLRAALERGRDGRRRLGVLVGVGLGLAIALLVLVLPSGRDGCRTPDEAPSRSWAERHEALEQRFIASGITQARNHGLHTARRFEQFAAQWDVERLVACSAADAAEPLADARMACLDRAAAGFEVVLEEIEALEPTRLGSASTLTLALPELGECHAPDPSATEVDRNASVREASRRLAEAATLVNLRRLAKAEEIVAALEAKGWVGSASVESRGWLVLANAAYARGAYERARQQGRSSLRAAELGDDAGEAAAAWAVLGNSELALMRLDEAVFAAERVESLATRVDDALLLADGKMLMGGVEVSRGRAEASVASFQLAERYLRAELGDHNKRLASLYQDMVPALVLSGRLEQAVAVARKSVTMHEALVGADSLLTVRARGGLGIALADLGLRDEAIEQLGRAEAGLAADPDAAPGDLFLVGLKRAEQLGMVGRSDEAVAALERLRPPADDPDAPMLIALTLGTLLLESGRAEDASAVYRSLLDTLEADGSHPIDMNRAITHANLAIALARSGRADEAVALVAPTIAEYEALGMSAARLGSVWIEFVGVYRAAGRLEDARRAAERGVAALERGDATPEALARARTELAAVEAALREEAAP